MVAELAITAELAIPAIPARVTITTVAEFTVATRPTTTTTTATVVTAAAATATVSAGAGRTAARSTATAGGSPALFRLADPDITAAKLGTVQLCHCRFAEFTAGEGDEGKTSKPPGFPVDRHVQVNNGLVLSEKLPQLSFRSVVRQISNIQFHRFLTSCRLHAFQAAVPLSGIIG
jgi:hypothetical protein